MLQCMKRVLDHIRFPKMPKNYIINYGMTFGSTRIKKKVNKDHIQEAIGMLTKARQRPAWFIGHLEPYNALAFLNGFNICLALLEGLDHTQTFKCTDIRNKLAKDKGFTSTSHIKDMRELGYSDPEIIDTLFELEIEVLKQFVALSDENNHT